MRRVLVVGPPGAGKSTFGRTISALMGLRLVHLDQLLWQPGWVQAGRTAFDAALAEVLHLQDWVIEGNYVRTLPQRLAAADTIVWLDFGRLICLKRVLWRTLRHYGRTRPDMTPGCPERFDLEFLTYIWSFQTRERPLIVSALEMYGGHTSVIRLGSPAEARLFLSSLS